ncbi:MAG: pilin [Luteibacter sp.]|uniref:pilin n=1 Tax=Luteibacter sp. TaxID=1886636 RepID=UPI002807DF60|nr:pilin [Luteibacter sp.]MDQ7997138.1 pilin [Luteibacter sp.]MDQ8049788.1 pilin [Luteibacter sp.]
MPIRRAAAGFTLIELMIVVAIIAILSAIAIPAYRDYVVRTQASEGFVIASGAKAAIWEFLTDKGAFPSSNLSAGLPSATSMNGKYVSSVTIENTGVVTVRYATAESNSNLKNSTLQLSPINAGGSIVWACNGTINPRFLPTTCRKT